VNRDGAAASDGAAVDHTAGDAAPAGAAAKLLAAIRDWQRQQPAPLVVAVDGRGAVGKTTLVTAVVALLPATVIHTDDFFLLPATSAPAPEIADYYDLARLRREALEPLRAGHIARYRGHDQSRPDAEPQVVALAPAGVILVEGVGACTDPLKDLVDRRVLVQVPDTERLARLRRLVKPGHWDDAWLAAESRYFDALGERLDLIIGTNIASAGSAER
jgi:hypothetical protein